MEDDERVALRAVKKADGFPRGSRFSSPVTVARVREKLPTPLGERRLRAALRSLEAANLIVRPYGRSGGYSLHAEGWDLLEAVRKDG